MPTDRGGSVTRWIGDLKAGDPEAARALWDRYFDRLVRLARARLRAASEGDADGEDAALSAFWCLCDGTARGRFPRLGDRDDLWRLLVILTARKAQDQSRRRCRQKRGGKTQVLGEADLFGAEPAAGEAALDRIIGTEPTPEFAALMAEQHRRLLDILGDETLRQVAVWRMEGYTAAEIAVRLGCVRQTVARKLDLIRQAWIAEVP